MAPLIAFAVGVLLSVGTGGRPPANTREKITPLKSDEDLIFFPTLSRQVETLSDGRSSIEWDVAIHGWIFEPEHTSLRRRAFIKFLRKVLDLEKGEEASEILERRLRPFLYDNERGKSLTVELLTDQLSGDCSNDQSGSGNINIGGEGISPKTRKRMPPYSILLLLFHLPHLSSSSSSLLFVVVVVSSSTDSCCCLFLFVDRFVDCRKNVNTKKCEHSEKPKC